MSHSASYSQLLKSSTEILQRYSLATMIQSYNVTTIHTMIQQHQVKLLACDTYDKGMELANSILISMTGFPATIDMFITNKTDLQELYSIMVTWRDSILIK